jgi:hypothetical protein
MNLHLQLISRTTTHQNLGDFENICFNHVSGEKFDVENYYHYVGCVYGKHSINFYLWLSVKTLKHSGGVKRCTC